MAPEYLMNKLIMQNAVRSLRSNSMFKRLVVPGTKRKTFADRAFSVYGPSEWNELPNDIKEGYHIRRFYIKTENLCFSHQYLSRLYDH